MWTWSIFSIQWYFCSATASKPPMSPIAANEGFRPPSVSTVVPGRMNSSWSSTTFSLRSLTGITEPREAALRLGGGGALLRARGVAVDVLAAELLDRGDQVGADALGDEGGVVVGLGIHRPGAAVGAHRHARHRLHAAGEDEVLPAGGDLLGGDVDGLEARGAEAVELHARDRVGQAGLDRGGLGDVARPGRRPGRHSRARRRRRATGSSFSLRTSVSCIRPTTRSTGLVPCREPLNLPFPRGVRIASKTSASVAAILGPPVS